MGANKTYGVIVSLYKSPVYDGVCVNSTLLKQGAENTRQLNRL